MALLAAGPLAGCRSSAMADPAKTFQDIRSDFRHGNLDVALQKAERARKDFSASSPDWPMKFRFLEAEILKTRVTGPEVITLLNSPGISYPAAGDLAIKRNLLCGLAHAKLGQAQQADKELQEAKRLSDASNSSLSGEVLRTRSCGADRSRPLDRGRGPLQESLKFARQQRDSFLEASDLMNLGFVGSELQHYDEAVALLNASCGFSQNDSGAVDHTNLPGKYG